MSPFGVFTEYKSIPEVLAGGPETKDRDLELRADEAGVGREEDMRAAVAAVAAVEVVRRSA